ncbi:MAG TPA: hypothetical protein VGQ30_15420 [Gemmatimonadaceae bacterium]|jgi:hypothetical protein|nr:hypothetical protein [Gemmatimonadaceae bacterium]
MTPGQHLPPEYDKGDETTVGGYAAVHSRPAALEGRDGMSYSLDMLSDSTGETAAQKRFGAYLIFIQWARLGAQKAEGHLETDFLAWGSTADEAERALGSMPLVEAQRALDALVLARDGDSTRRWWDVMREDTADGAE